MEHPILFSAPMVRAILEGRKTQTRRVVTGMALDWLRPNGFTPQFVADPENGLSRYGYRGDLLWVRETFGVHENIICNPSDRPNFKDKAGVWHPVVHFAGKQNYAWGMYGPPRKRPGIHMPRTACRLILEIVGMRIERLQDVSEEDAQAEGVDFIQSAPAALDHRTAFAGLWNSINASRGFGWSVNPWVWVIEFEEVK